MYGEVHQCLDKLNVSLTEKLCECCCTPSDAVEAPEQPAAENIDEQSSPQLSSTPSFADSYYFDTRPRERELRATSDDSLKSLASTLERIGVVLSRLDEISEMNEDEWGKYEYYNEIGRLHREMSDDEVITSDYELHTVAEAPTSSNCPAEPPEQVDCSLPLQSPKKKSTKKAKQHARRAARVMM